MLIQKSTVSSGDVISIRLVSGEELIGKYISGGEGDTPYMINRPVVIHVQMVSQQEARIAFGPFLAGTPDDITISINQQAVAVRPVLARSDVKNGYQAATSSIVPANAAQASGLLSF